MKYFLPRRSWLVVLGAVGLFVVTAEIGRSDGGGGSGGSGGGSGSKDSGDVTVFGDGFFKKFGLDLGYAGRTHRWAIYTYGAGTSSSQFTALDVSAPSSTTQFGYQIMGDIALAGAYSNLKVSGYGSMSGDRYERTTSTESPQGGNTTIAGTRYSSGSVDSALISGIASLQNVSTTAAGLSPTSGSPTSINYSGTSMTFDNNPFGGKYVMSLSNFILNNQSVLILKGVAGSAFVINVSGSFSLDNGSKIRLVGGLTPSDVLFNVTGNSGTFSIAGNSLFKGTLLAYNSAGAQRTLTVSGNNTLIRGQIIANKVIVTDGAKVRKPRKVSKGRDEDDDERERERECD